MEGMIGYRYFLIPCNIRPLMIFDLFQTMPKFINNFFLFQKNIKARKEYIQSYLSVELRQQLMNIISKVHCVSNASYSHTSNALEHHGGHDTKRTKIDIESKKEDSLPIILLAAKCDTR